MGTHVLSAQSSDPYVYSFAHYAKEPQARAGAVAVALVNIASSERSVSFHGVDSSRQERYCLTSSALDSDAVSLNGGAHLEMADDGSMPELRPRSVSNGTLVLPARSACFVTLRGALTACS
jgi:hypothetical protein